MVHVHCSDTVQQPADSPPTTVWRKRSSAGASTDAAAQVGGRPLRGVGARARGKTTPGPQDEAREVRELLSAAKAALHGTDRRGADPSGAWRSHRLKQRERRRYDHMLEPQKRGHFFSFTSFSPSPPSPPSSTFSDSVYGDSLHSPHPPLSRSPHCVAWWRDRDTCRARW